MQWNDSINNEGDHLSLTKTCVLERIKTLACREEGKTAMNLPRLKFSPSSRELTKTRPRSQTHTSLIDSHFALLHFDATAATAPAIPAPSHAEIAEQRAVKGACALSLGDIKDAESCHASPPPSPAIPSGLVSSSPSQMIGARGICVDLCKSSSRMDKNWSTLGLDQHF